MIKKSYKVLYHTFNGFNQLRGIPDKDAQKYGAAERLSIYSLKTQLPNEE